MRTSKRFTALALVAGLAVMASACGSDKKAEPAATTTGVAASTTTAGSGSSTPGTDGSGGSTPGTGSTGGKVDGTGKSACEVTDSGGVDDKGFNQTAYDGVKQAATEFGIKPELLESKSDADYTPNIDAFVKKKCSIIITVGFLLAPNTATAAKANPDQQFAIVDSTAMDDNGTPSDTTDDKPLPNVSALLFATEQPSYLAGYLAAGMSKSGKVATYGGIQIPPVTSFMNGFLQGVNQHNKVHGTKVTVLGWDGKEGSFTKNFTNLDDGKRLTQGFVDEGADIVFPVAGPVGLGTSAYAKENPGKIRVIGVDVDQYVSNPKEQSVYLTSVQKKIDAAVLAAIKNVVTTGKVGKDYLGTLANGGLDLAPFHDQAKDVPQALQDEIAGLKKDIISGKITVTA